MWGPLTVSTYWAVPRVFSQDAARHHSVLPLWVPVVFLTGLFLLAQSLSTIWRCLTMLRRLFLWCLMVWPSLLLIEQHSTFVTIIWTHIHMCVNLVVLWGLFLGWSMWCHCPLLLLWLLVSFLVFCASLLVFCLSWRTDTLKHTWYRANTCGMKLINLEMKRKNWKAKGWGSQILFCRNSSVVAGFPWLSGKASLLHWDIFPPVLDLLFAAFFLIMVKKTLSGRKSKLGPWGESKRNPLSQNVLASVASSSQNWLKVLRILLCPVRHNPIDSERRMLLSTFCHKCLWCL